MAISDIHYRTGTLLRVTSNGQQVLSKITKRLQKIVSIADDLARTVAEIFVERAKRNLIDFGRENNYSNMAHYADNIYVHKYKNNNYRVGIKENSDKPVMFLLEFGTGLVGKDGVHDIEGFARFATENGWQYATTQSTYSYNKRFDNWGWWFFDEKTNKFVFTSGLYPVAYLFRTINELPDIIKEARRRFDL